MATNKSCLNDDTIGPAVEGCRGDFDFTLLFEQVFFRIVPSSIFLLAATTRITLLCDRSKVVAGSTFLTLKVATILVNCILEIAFLVLSTLQSSNLERRWNIAASSLAILEAVMIGGLSICEHRLSVRSSGVLVSYLCLILLFGAVRCRTLWLSSVEEDSSLASLFTAIVTVKFVILVLEAQGKSRWAQSHDHDGKRSPEETAGVLSLSLSIWLNDLFRMGSKKILSVEDLYPLENQLIAYNLELKFGKQWERRRGKKQFARMVSTIAGALNWHLLYPVLPRLALIGFSFSQPFLINTILRLLETPTTRATTNDGYGLIGATFFVYAGIAISTNWYWYLHQRALCMLRSMLVSTIVKKATSLTTSSLDKAAALTLANTDVDRIQGGLHNFHEVWANMIEVGLASWLLQRQLGLAFIAPITVVILCFAASFTFGKILGKRQGQWMEATQKRVGATAETISSMASLKMSGLSEQVACAVHTMRLRELEAASAFRLLTVVTTVIAFTPQLISPFVTFAFSGRGFNAARIFTSLSYLLLLTNPLTQLFQSIPQIVIAITSLKRVNEFLSIAARIDYRRFRPTQDIHPLLEMADVQSNPAITIRNGEFGWEKGRPILNNVNLTIPKSKLTIVTGSVGSGKSTFCKVLLGEIPHAKGDVVLSDTLTQIGFCDQSPCLFSGSIKENIIGHSAFEYPWYNEILHATALNEDFVHMTHGDETVIDTTGRNLSGGQRQRVAMARSLYSRHEIYVFDDSLSGLDAATRDHIFRHVFGPDGVLSRQRATVVLCSQSRKDLKVTDHILLIEAKGPTIKEGSFQALFDSDTGTSTNAAGGQGETQNGKSIDEEEIGKPQASDSPKISTGVVDPARRTGDVAVYKYYFSILGIRLFIMLITFGAVFAFLYNFSSVWLKFWSDFQLRSRRGDRKAYYIGIYGMLQFLGLLMLGVFVKHTLSTIFVRSGTQLHRLTLNTLMHATLTYLNTVETGHILNRFSQDMSLIDGDLTFALSNTTLAGFTGLGQAFVIAIASPYVAIGYPFLMGMLYLLQKYYLQTSRQLRFLDLEAKSPLYEHLLSTMNGLTTLRAFGWIYPTLMLNSQLLDTSQRPAYLLAMIQQWLTLVLNLFITVIATNLVALATQLSVSSSSIGVSLVSLMSFGEMLSSIIRSWTQLETSIGAVSRLKSFNETVENEGLLRDGDVPPESWPKDGRIEINRVSASYASQQGDQPADVESREASAFVLKDITISVAAGEKVAICGRTGSGKSSLLLLLLSFINPLSSSEQAILIDGHSTCSIHPATLRSRIIALPQTAFLLPDGSSFQENLDPDNNCGGTECEEILDRLGLSDFVKSRGGLSSVLKRDSLSQGQQQLFSLARAVLRARAKQRSCRRRDYGHSSQETEKKSEAGILLLDEFSSSVDADTDALMQNVVTAEFQGYTVLAAAHRLDTILDFDRVLVMDDGAIVEERNPRVLLDQWGGRFKEQYELTLIKGGPAAAGD